MSVFKGILTSIVASASLYASVSAVAAADDVASFYSGKTITLVIGYSPGGGYDQYARLVAKHLGRFIPGNPSIVPENMPGAGSRTSIAYIHSHAPQDGTVLGTGDQSMPLFQAIDADALGFDMRDLNFLGTPVVSNNVFVTWHTSGIETVEDAKARPVPIATTGSATTEFYPRILNAVLGTQFELIGGYPGGNDMDRAMEQGEVEGRGSNSWSSYKAMKRSWIDDNLLNVITQIGVRPEPDLLDVPLIHDLAENDEDREMMRLLSLPMALGRPIYTTPNVPEDRLNALREAFAQMVEDEAFLADAATQQLEISPLLGLEVEQAVDEIINTSPELVQRLVDATGLAGAF